ncbi:Trk system potassium transporter TrkA [Clostridium colicanis]|uniref:Trk system potassium uptake protein TrkA n=1 Tax=Clostridium colicanis DSM 13634 TaxID=1121305 RepID=A0A151AL21_9CLOT|nr:Trk system potassium transporter TrkA [Clostridium colicanis]KYH28312.1 Trk system potassium uptake protein TrkA [Clostridium colicanis DSM 13634]
MKIIIIGAGKVGYNLAESLEKEGNDVTIIDKNPAALKRAEENLDVMCIRGNGISTSTLLEAGVRGTDLLIAVTNSDEVNIVCCLTAKKLKAAHTIARIRDTEYARELSLLKEELGLEMVINPEMAAADEIAQRVNFSSAVNVENFSKGMVKMVEFKITRDMPIVGQALENILSKFKFRILVGIVVRGEEVIVPNGKFVIEENDRIHVIGKYSSIYNFSKMAGVLPQKLKNIMILGGGRIAYYLASMLLDMGVNVKIIEIDKERCVALSELLPRALIINADGTDEELLLSENIKDMDGFIAVTGMDEENLLSSLVAKQNGVKKVITKISRTNYSHIVNSLGLDNVIIPKIIVANQILKYVRGNNIESLYRIVDGKVEILEFIANHENKILNIPLKQIKFKEDVIIATIVRKKKIIIPHGEDSIQEGDRVIVISKDKNINKLEDLISSSNGGKHNELWDGIKKLGEIINM